jgi:dipeptidyl aminopeptidase/acylaminoacyl peptidase
MGAVSAQVKTPPTVEAFGRVPAIGAVALSPSGRWVAWIDNSGTTPMIEIFDLEKSASPKRVCIAGMSYGGYAALAGAAFTPELYACVISVNGVSDLPNMLGYERRYSGDESDTVAYWKEHIGPANSTDVIGRSPARAARNVRAPVLLLHGADDSVVPIAQSQGMMRALGGNPPHQLIELPGEDHWLSRSATRIRVLTEMERFLAKHLPVTGQAAD